MSNEGEKSSWLEPLPEEYAAEGDMTGRRMLVAALTVIILAIFGGLIWYSYMESNNSGPVPVVRADKSVVKIKPDTPGGLQVPDQDKNVFNKITSANNDKADTLAPSAELPLERPVAVAGTEPEPAPLPPKMDSKTTEAAARKVAAIAPSSAGKPGRFFVQLGAFSKKTSAEKLWEKLEKDNATLLSGLAADIMMIDLGKKGALYRLRGGMITTRGEAKDICDTLKAKKQACIVVTK
ncbi:hypothetical protein MNBD_ALPHA02-1514 [hydrothermal vent metagenome]|uniref:SPOR domain-containing protein n=1 Tax=hydrothermal vent metagenome TaxID=652676 RepID=A0A3B0RT45_9ZZZZ